MKYIKTFKSFLIERVTSDGEVICDNCGWKWNIVQGGNDPYNCHKCGHKTSKVSESISTVLSKDEIINMQRKGARTEDEWDMIKDKSKDTKFELEENVPIDKIQWDNKDSDILEKQKKRLQRLKDESNGSQTYLRRIKDEEVELAHIENLIKMIKSRDKLNPLIVDKNYRLLDGYHRIGAYKHLGIKKVNVYKEI